MTVHTTITRTHSAMARSGGSRTEESLCDALFAAVLIDDDVDPETRLPDRLRLDYPVETFQRCFGLCQALWRSGYDRATLLDLTATLLRTGDLDAADRVRFKHIRAKFKHFRYAFRLYDRRSRDPWLLDRTTITMGHLQDAYRNREVDAVRMQARLLTVLLSRPLHWRLTRDAMRFEPKSGAAFRRMLEIDRNNLRELLARATITGAALHTARKIVGRQVSFYDTLRTLEPDDYAFRMSRSLSAINGLMGRLHDDLVAARATDAAGYHDRMFVLPPQIRERLAAFAAL